MKSLSSCVQVFIAALLAANSLFASDAAIQPNVLFVIADDASQKLGEVYQRSWIKTPNIDRLARGGLVFDNAYVPTSKCAPCRAGILTGRNPWQLEAAGNHQALFPTNYKAFTEALSDSGFYVGSQGKTWGPGSARMPNGDKRTFGFKSGSFAQFLTQRPTDKPFFFWYGSHNPHRVYQPDAGLAVGKKPSDIDHVPAYMPDNDVVRRDLLDYATEVEEYDREIGNLLSTLEANGLDKNTLVVITSDHGMPFPRVKGHTYDDAHRVPLVMRWPTGIAKPGRRIPDLVGSIDFAPTFLELFGVDPEKAGMAPITGRSLTDLLRGEPKMERPFVIIGRERNDVLARPGTEHGLGYPTRGIRSGDYLLVKNFEPDRWPCGNPDMGLLDTDNGPSKQLVMGFGPGDKYWEHAFGKRPELQLFDVTKDPDCVVNLAQDTALGPTRERLLAMLTYELKRQQDPRIFGNGRIFDEYPSAKSAAKIEKKDVGAKKPKT